jgi:hypothetical protein
MRGARDGGAAHQSNQPKRALRHVSPAPHFCRSTGSNLARPTDALPPPQRHRAHAHAHTDTHTYAHMHACTCTHRRSHTGDSQNTPITRASTHAPGGVEGVAHALVLFPHGAVVRAPARVFLEVVHSPARPQRRVLRLVRIGAGAAQARDRAPRRVDAEFESLRVDVVDDVPAAAAAAAARRRRRRRRRRGGAAVAGRWCKESGPNKHLLRDHLPTPHVGARAFRHCERKWQQAGEWLSRAGAVVRAVPCRGERTRLRCTHLRP